MGLITPGGENLLNFLVLWQVLSTYDGDLRDPLWWPQERPVPMRVFGGLSGFLSSRCRGLRQCVQAVPEAEDFSPVLKWILGNFLSCSKGVKEPLEFQRLGVISLETPQRKWASSRLEGRSSWIFSSCGRCSRLTTGTSGTHSGGLRKGQSPWSCSGASWDSSPVDAGA